MPIGTLSEKSLHAALKAHYGLPDDQLECALDGYVIDILRPTADDSCQCIEIQTRNLGSMKPKLQKLLDNYPIRIVHPVAQQRTIVRIDADGVIQSQRKSPKHGTVYDIFPELVSFPALVCHPNFALEVLLIHEEQIWFDDKKGSWRRKRWSIHDRRLVEIVKAIPLTTPADFAALLPAGLPTPFDSGELASAIHQPRHLAQKMAYCLREMGVLQVVGKRRNSLLYAVV